MLSTLYERSGPPSSPPSAETSSLLAPNPWIETRLEALEKAESKNCPSALRLVLMIVTLEAPKAHHAKAALRGFDSARVPKQKTNAAKRGELPPSFAQFGKGADHRSEGDGARLDACPTLRNAQDCDAADWFYALVIGIKPTKCGLKVLQQLQKPMIH